MVIALALDLFGRWRTGSILAMHGERGHPNRFQVRTAHQMAMGIGQREIPQVPIPYHVPCDCRCSCCHQNGHSCISTPTCGLPCRLLHITSLPPSSSRRRRPINFRGRQEMQKWPPRFPPRWFPSAHLQKPGCVRDMAVFESVTHQRHTPHLVFLSGFSPQIFPHHFCPACSRPMRKCHIEARPAGDGCHCPIGKQPSEIGGRVATSQDHPDEVTK